MTSNNRIKALRKKNNLSQRQLSKKLLERGIHISNEAISKYETGSRNPSRKKWSQLATFFNVSINYLQGNGVQNDEILSKLVKTIHNKFFNEKDSSNLRILILEFLNYTNQIDVPSAFYKPNEQKHKLNPQIFNFWKSCFHDITEDYPFIDSLEGINNYKDWDYILTAKLESIVVPLRDKSKSDLAKFIITSNFLSKVAAISFKNDLQPNNSTKSNLATVAVTVNYYPGLNNKIKPIEFTDDLDDALDIEDVKVYDSDGKDITNENSSEYDTNLTIEPLEHYLTKDESYKKTNNKQNNKNKVIKNAIDTQIDLLKKLKLNLNRQL